MNSNDTRRYTEKLRREAANASPSRWEKEAARKRADEIHERPKGAATPGARPDASDQGKVKQGEGTMSDHKQCRGVTQRLLDKLAEAEAKLAATEREREEAVRIAQRKIEWWQKDSKMFSDAFGAEKARAETALAAERERAGRMRDFIESRCIHTNDCTKHPAGNPCNCGLDEFLSSPSQEPVYNSVNTDPPTGASESVNTPAPAAVDWRAKAEEKVIIAAKRWFAPLERFPPCVHYLAQKSCGHESCELWEAVDNLLSAKALSSPPEPAKPAADAFEECECGHTENDHEGSFDMKRAYCGGGLAESCSCRSWRPKEPADKEAGL